MKTSLQQNACTCIIPFYNERERIMRTLKILTTVKNIAKIICVDDGSTDNGHELIQKTCKQVKVIRSEKNQGKSTAVQQALPYIETEYTMLFDADIHDFKSTEIERAISIVINDKDVGMLILRRENEPFLIRITRGELVLSGERILSTEDLLEVYKHSPKSYQLEIAINQYMTEKKKAVYWFAYTGRNTFKAKKVGLVKGLLKELEMYQSVGSYIGYRKYLEDLLFFCNEEYKN